MAGLASRLADAATAVGRAAMPSDSRILFSIFARQLRVFAQESAGVVAALADFFALVGVPGAGLFHHLGFHAHVDDFAFAADALAIEDYSDRKSVV